MKLNWFEVHAIGAPPLDRLKGRYPFVFRHELGETKGVELKLDIDRTVPRFTRRAHFRTPSKLRSRSNLIATDIASGVLVPVKDSEWDAPNCSPG